MMNKINYEQLMSSLQEKAVLLELLQKENSELNKKLETLNTKLEESESFKSHFISNVTNEIINPFSSIMGLSKTIMQFKGIELKKASSLAELIYSEAAFLDFQLTNIFAAARIEAGEIAVEASDVNLSDLLDTVIKKLHHELKKKSLNLKIEIEKTGDSESLDSFVTDKEKLQLIVINLLSNAIRASEKEKSITIAVKPEAHKLRIERRDEGIGIDEDEKEKIFDRFRRIDLHINSLNPGNGLGLSVVKGLIDILSGEITINSKPEKGTSITVILPEASVEDKLIDDDLFSDIDEENF